MKNHPSQRISQGLQQMAATFLCLISIFSCAKQGRVTPVEAKDPWMVVVPWKIWPKVISSHTVPFADKDNSDILYLVEIEDNPRILKINLKLKSIEIDNTKIQKWEDADKVFKKYKSGFNVQADGMGPLPYKTISPLLAKFDGKTYPYTYTHWYGYPIASDPKRRTATFGAGSWSLLYSQNGQYTELLKYNIDHVEMDNYGFNEIDIDYSPDNKWICYRLNKPEGIIFIFNRDATITPPPHWVNSNSYRWNGDAK